MRKIKILLIALVLGGVFCSNIYAANVERNLGAGMERPFTPAKYQYRVKSDASGNSVVYTVVKIFDDADRQSNNLLYSRPFYCLRGGVGFGASSTDPSADVSKDAIKYIQTEKSEMHTNAKEVIAKYKDLYGVDLNRTEQFNVTEIDGSIKQKSVNIYNAILWVLDESYLPRDIKNSENETVYSATEYKRELLEKAGVPTSQQDKITDDDLEVIQQLAIWYFVNYDEQVGNVKPTVSQDTMFPAKYLSINGNNDFETSRINNLNRIYQYLVYGAIDNASTYNINDTTEVRSKDIEKIEFDKTEQLKIESNNSLGLNSYYEIGPVKINSSINQRSGSSFVDVTSIVLYDANGLPIDKDYKTLQTDESSDGQVYESMYERYVYVFVDSSGERVTSLQEGTEYYIRFFKAFEKGSKIIPFIKTEEQYDISKVTLKLTSSYSLAEANFLYAKADSSTNQAVVELEKEKVSSTDEITTKEFDLSLRKFITAIKRNGQNVQIEDRKPSINLSKLNTIDARLGKITTATYTHPKNELTVETGDKVTYTIRIYNEGELDGKATEITDYLPSGLKLVPASESQINATYRWVEKDGKITTEYLKDTNIKAYDPSKTTGESGWQKAATGNSGLYYADVKVECEVVAQVAANDQDLRNIAEISADNGDDRDSTPNNVDRNSYNPPADNSEYQQDDDDYEDLVLKTKSFDLSLRKFITKIERINKQTSEKEELPLESREPIIKIAGLKAGQTTAKYVHPKNTISLKRGDIITYTIRVYNEGDLNGYVLEVKDYLPEGLELVEGENEIWTANGNTLTTTSLNNQLLLGYNKQTTSVANGVKWQKASDDETGLYYYDLQVVCKLKDDVADGAVLKNVAEISSDRSEPTDIDDRDSTPGNVNQDNKHTPGAEVDGYTPGEQDDDDFERVTVEPNQVFDLALRKYIVAVEAQNLEGEASRIPNIDINPLKGVGKTADYNHKKHPVEVKIGDVVTYRFSVYNEGEIDGYVYSIVDYLPAGLTFDVEANSNFIQYKESYSTEEIEGKEYAYKIEGNKITILPLNSDKLFELTAFNGTTLDSKSINAKFKVTAQESNNDQILTNVATMTYAAKGTDTADRDSSKDTFTVPSAEKLLEGLPGYKGKDSNDNNLEQSDYHYEGQEDDDDFEKIIIKGKPFDLALRKFITSIKRNGSELEIVDRTPSINTETLISGTYNRNGQLEYTATYEHSKEPLLVKQGDIITYTLRIYNEGERDGYASEITDYIPEGLALIKDYKTTFNYGWKLSDNVNSDNIIKLVGENGFYKTEEEVKNLKLEDFSAITSLKDVELIKGKEKITTSDLNDELIKSFDKNKTEAEAGWQKASTGEGGLYYKDVEVSFLVIAPNTCKDVLTNIAEISEDRDKNGNPVDDRDSIPNNKKDPYSQTQEDDDDYEPVVLRYFDLALRKFITGVETNGKLTDVTSRIPQLSINEETGNIKYTHPKQEAPVAVANNDIVIYTLRVYNEGTLAGYAEEITDDIPEGLIFMPEHDVNKQYEWKMFDKDGNATESLEEVNTIKTDYLSKEKESENRINLINSFDSSKGITDTNPEYKDIKVAFRVIEQNTSDRIIINSAQISEDSDDDEDSDPHKWNDGEDDQDKEYIYVKYFDLSLLKWVTQTIVTVDGKTTTTETGFKPNTGLTETTGIRDNKENEPVAKVELDKKKLNKTTVKFAYKIRVTNEGEIAGYATEVTDFIPEGLEFKAEDNKKHGWVKEGENKVTTRALETVLLEPGESAELEIVFRWKNDKNNLGVKTNIAEITEDYNEHNSKDIDSTPKNKKDPYEKEQEDDDDFALVVLSLKTGKGAAYTLLITTIIAMLAGGIYLIKKYVLTY